MNYTHQKSLIHPFFPLGVGLLLYRIAEGGTLADNDFHFWRLQAHGKPIVNAFNIFLMQFFRSG